LAAVYTDKEISKSVVSTNLHKISQIRFLTDETFVLRLDRGDLEFKAGQHIIAGPEGELDLREYSVYSGENDDYLEILVREVKEGNVSLKLRDSKPGQLLQVNGPFGSFGPEKFDMYSRKLVFISTGTGISPFHSIVRSYPGIDYTLIHGVRHKREAYEREDYDPGRYILCTSKESSGGMKGRVTKFLSSYPVDRDMLFYLCGSSSMIYEVRHILGDKGIPDNNIFTEMYF
jgi:ferredoxin--NADP+ reductase/benzoate/toluate 1,2-dioxygenase reductase subunit